MKIKSIIAVLLFCSLVSANTPTGYSVDLKGGVVGLQSTTNHGNLREVAKELHKIDIKDEKAVLENAGLIGFAQSLLEAANDSSLENQEDINTISEYSKRLNEILYPKTRAAPVYTPIKTGKIVEHLGTFLWEYTGFTQIPTGINFYVRNTNHCNDPRCIDDMHSKPYHTFNAGGVWASGWSSDGFQNDNAGVVQLSLINWDSPDGTVDTTKNFANVAITKSGSTRYVKDNISGGKIDATAVLHDVNISISASSQRKYFSINATPTNVIRDGVIIQVSFLNAAMPAIYAIAPPDAFDSTPPTDPVITVTLPPTTPSQINTDWYLGSIDVVVDGSTDVGTGVKGYEYKLDTGDWIAYTSKFQITNSTLLSVRAVDKNNNYSKVVTKQLNIDTINPTAPVINSSNTLEWCNEDVIVSLSGSTDSQSGIEGYYYDKTDMGSWVKQTSDLVITTNCRLTGKAIDNSGRQSIVTYKTYKFDRIEPTKPNIYIEI